MRSCRLYTGCRVDRKQVTSTLILALHADTSFDVPVQGGKERSAGAPLSRTPPWLGRRRLIPRLIASGGYSVCGIRLGKGLFSRRALISSMRKAMVSRPCCSRLVVTVMILPTNCPPQVD
jgi:hypothetical protein